MVKNFFEGLESFCRLRGRTINGNPTVEKSNKYGIKYKNNDEKCHYL